MSIIYENLLEFTWQQGVMILIGALLIFLAIKKEMEPTLLLPLGFGTILVNIPNADAALETVIGGITHRGPLLTLFDAGIANELFPLILFIGIGAMIDFGPLLSNPKLMLFGAAAQFGIFFTLCTSSMFFDINDAASVAVIGAADGPTSIVVAQALNSKYLGAIMVAAYSYMALVPIIQPPIIRLLTTKKERLIRMPYEQKTVSKRTRILFPIVITVVVAAVVPASSSLIGFLMFGNLIRECGVLFAKFLNLFLRKKVNPMIGAAGISAFPMSGRIVHKMGLAEDPQNFLLMHSIGVNVSGQIASVIAGGLILKFFGA